MKLTRRQLRALLQEAIGDASAGWPSVPPSQPKDRVSFEYTRQGTKKTYDAAYDTDQFLPGVKSLAARFKGYAVELTSADFRDMSGTVHNEVSTILSSFERLIEALEDASVTYTRGPFGGKLKAKHDIDRQ